jgi:hypothetical protein
MKITGLYAWTIATEVEVPDDATNEQQREALDNSVEDCDPSQGPPILHECSNPELID